MAKQISTYTQKLERLRLVEREVPVTEDKTRSRRGRYRILDPLFRFWFRFVYGNEDRYERLGADAYERRSSNRSGGLREQSIRNPLSGYSA